MDKKVGADKWIYIIVTILMGIGLIFSYSLPIYLETIKGWGEFHFFYKFLAFSAMGIMIIYFLSQCNPNICIKRIGFGLLFIGGILIFLMPTPILAPYCPKIKGAIRWIKIFGFTISPIEFFKIGMIYFFAWGLSRKLSQDDFHNYKEEIKAILPYLVILGIMAFYIVIYQSDLGETLLIFMIFIIMLFFTKVSSKTFGILLLIGGIIFIFGLMQGGYRVKRFESSLNNIYLLLPQSIQNLFDVSISTNDISYQIRQSLNAIYNGGLIGQGIGNGQLKLGYLSDVHTDFVLAGITEEIGFFGVMIVMLLILALIWRIFKIANRVETKSYTDNVNKLFVMGVGILIGLETILNSMGIIGFFPLKGLPIPFISYGGSAIISFSIAIGMVLMISKKAKL
jgi:cell division protein FtsW